MFFWIYVVAVVVVSAKPTFCDPSFLTRGRWHNSGRKTRKSTPTLTLNPTTSLLENKVNHIKKKKGVVAYLVKERERERANEVSVSLRFSTPTPLG